MFEERLSKYIRKTKQEPPLYNNNNKKKHDENKTEWD